MAFIPTNEQSSFRPSPQQAALFSWVVKGKGNAFVQAVAGAGKTTSLVEAAKLMKGSKLLVAFNKKIADELTERIVANGISNAEGKTFHAKGMEMCRPIMAATKKFTKKPVDGYKVSNIIQEMNIEEDYIQFVRKIVSLAKQIGIGALDMAIENESLWIALVEKHDLEADLVKNKEENITVEKGIKIAMDVLRKNNTIRHIIDFDDMIYFPILFDVKPLVQYDWLMVDEAQDTNPVRRALAMKLVKPKGRMIWVGDKHQAIYGFTGADSNAVDLIIKECKCTELPLTVTYRCPKAVVAAAQAYVSHITAHESAPQGEVVHTDMAAFETDTSLKGLTANDAILCRKTAPLVKLAYRLIRHGVPCQIEGKNDLGAQILQMLKKWKRVRSLADFLDKLADWETTQIAKLSDEKGKPKKGKGSLIENIQDRAETVRYLCEGCEDLDCVRDKVTRMFGDLKEGEAPRKTILSTVHKSKGREWHNVYVYGFKEWMPSKMATQAWQIEQENNLIYVSFTRAQKKLTLVG